MWEERVHIHGTSEYLIIFHKTGGLAITIIVPTSTRISHHRSIAYRGK